MPAVLGRLTEVVLVQGCVAGTDRGSEEGQGSKMGRRMPPVVASPTEQGGAWSIIRREIDFGVVLSRRSKRDLAIEPGIRVFGHHGLTGVDDSARIVYRNIHIHEWIADRPG
jgi:hypothetical protein